MTPNQQSEIYLGDLAQAFHALGPRNDHTRAAIARILGFEFRSRSEPTTGRRDTGRAAPEQAAETPSRIRHERDRLSTPVTDQSEPLALKPRKSSSAKTSLLEILRGPALPLPTGGGSDWTDAHLTAPLLRPKITSSTIFYAAARMVEEGPIDTQALCDRFTRPRRHRSMVPRMSIPTLRYGVQIVVDRRVAMQPFYADQDQLVADVKQVVGASAVEVLAFDQDPYEITGRTLFEREPYRPPAAGTPVLLLSDLGIGRAPAGAPPPPAELWAAYSTALSFAGNPLIVLNPYPSRRWPTRLGRKLAIIEWDRGSTPNHAKRASRAAGGAVS